MYSWPQGVVPASLEHLRLADPRRYFGEASSSDQPLALQSSTTAGALAVAAAPSFSGKYVVFYFFVTFGAL